LSVFGRSTDFTGRDALVQLWPTFFWEKPMLGYGFGGFFTGQAGSPAEQLSYLLSKAGMYSTFENAYLDILIQFGLVGGILYASILIKAVLKSAQFYKSSMSMYKVVPINVLACVLATSFSESSLLQQNFVVCVFVFWIYFGVDRVGVYMEVNRS